MFAMSQRGERKRLLGFALAYVCIWLLTWYSARVFETMGVVSLWYLPGGLRFFCLLLLGPTGLLVEIFTALVLLLLQTALSNAPAPALWSSEFSWAAYNLCAFPLSFAVLVLPLRWWVRKALDFSRPIHSVLFLVAALGSAALAALAGTFSLMSSGIITSNQSTELFFSWLTGDFVGIITLAPLLWVVATPRVLNWLQQGIWRLPPRPIAVPGNGRTYQDTTLVVVLALLLIFGLPQLLGITQVSPMVTLLLLLPLAGLTLHYGLRSAVLAIVLLDSGLVVSVALLQQRQWALQYQLVMIAIALVGLWLGGAVEASKRVMERLKDFSGVSNDLLWETDAEGLLTASGRLANQLSLAPGVSWSTLLKEISQPHMDALEKALSQREPFHRLEVAFQPGLGPRRWFSINGLPLWNESGERNGYRGTATEITDAVEARALLSNYNQELLTQVAQRTAELTRSHSELAIKEQHLQVLLAAAPVGLMELDSQDQCRYLNDNGCALLDVTQDEARGRNLIGLIDPEDRARVAQCWSETTPESGVRSVEFRLKGSNLWCAAYWIKFRPLDKSSDSTIMVLVDATARHLQEQQLWALAHHDALTGLPNRALFLDRCHQVFAQAKRKGAGAAMLWLDLDGFKSVNDTLGHAAGDALLQQVAQRLKSRVRDGDTVARMGGDEFAVILPEVSQADGALHIATTLVELLGTAYHLPQGTVAISASIGVALYPLHATTVETLMQQADSAMYSVKRSGKNKVQLAGIESGASSAPVPIG
jgi:diguanylate cyclase (GGDEF)-like protein/PAS domain S-box-containing protein